MHNDHSLSTSETDIFYKFFFQTTKINQIFNSATCKQDKTVLKHHFYYYIYIYKFMSKNGTELSEVYVRNRGIALF